MTITRGFSSVASAALNSRPRTIGMPIVLK